MSAPASDEPWLELHDYWLAKHVDGRPPSRADLDPPLEIPRLVKQIMLVDTTDGELRYRLIGSSVAAGMQMDPTGKIAGATGYTSPEVGEAWRSMLAAVRDEKKPLLVITSLPGADVAMNHCIALPLVAPDGHVEQVMVGIFYGGYARSDVVVAGLAIEEVRPIGSIKP